MPTTIISIGQGKENNNQDAAVLATLQCQQAVWQGEAARADVLLRSELVGLEHAVRAQMGVAHWSPRVMAAKLRVVMAQSEVMAARAQVQRIREMLAEAEEAA